MQKLVVKNDEFGGKCRQPVEEKKWGMLRKGRRKKKKRKTRKRKRKKEKGKIGVVYMSYKSNSHFYNAFKIYEINFWYDFPLIKIYFN